MMGTAAKDAKSTMGDSPHVVIRASAGTGKTHQLSSRYLRLIHAGHPVERILATTFTRKAAGEILDRVLFRLAQSCSCDDERHQLATDLGASSLTPIDCQNMLQRLTVELHRVRVSTLDSYFGQIARTFGLELGLPPAWDILDEHDDFGLRRMALHEMLAADEHYVRELVHLLTKGEASRGVSQLILSTVRDVYELYKETIPDHGAAWNGIAEAPLLPAEQLSDAIDALEAIDVLTGFKKTRDAAIEDARNDDWSEFVRKGLVPKILSNGVFNRKKIPEQVVAAYQPLITHARGYFIQQLRKQTQGAFHLAREFDGKYEQIKISQKAILFNDVPQKLGAMADSPHTDRLAYRMDAQVDHMLLDEFQDTSSLQWNTLLPLASRITECTDGSSSYLCVGDRKQSIYGWRGGQPEIIGTMQLLLNHLRVEELTESRRSAPPVIDAVNEVFLNWRQHDNLGDYEPCFESWPFRKHTTLKKTTGYVCLQAAEFDQDDPKSTVLRCTARLVRDLHSQAPGNSIGVLVRKNETVGQLIYYLGDLHVPASEEGGNPLTDSAAVQQILSLLQMVDHPSDAIARFHVAHGPLGTEFDLNRDDAHSIDNHRVARSAARRIRRDLIDNGYGPCVHRWAKILAPACSRRELQRLEQFVDVAYAYEARSSLRTIDFIRFVQTDRVADPSSAPVRVMTIHQSKGLEFDSVVLTSLEENITRLRTFAVKRHPRTFRPEKIIRYAGIHVRNLFPDDIREIFDADLRTHVHEYLCGLYVSMTRARRSLHMVVEPYDKKHRRTTAGLLRATLAPNVPVVPGQVIYEHGDPDWFRNDMAKEERASTAPTDWEDEVLRLNLRKRGLNSERGQPTTSPSRKSQSELNGSMIFSAARDQSLDFGSLIHAWMEGLVWLEVRPSDDSLKDTAVRIGSPTVNLKNAISTFHEMLARDAVVRLLTESCYRDDVNGWLEVVTQATRPSHAPLEVYNEQRIHYVEDGKLGSGSIDRLVLFRKGDELVAADIIDWKTDPAGSDEAARELCQHYAPQLHAYRQAVHEMFRIPLSAIRMQLVFLTDGRVEQVTPHFSS